MIQPIEYIDYNLEFLQIFLFVSAVLVGFGQTSAAFAAKKYAYQSSWLDETSKKFVDRMENIMPFAGMVAMSWMGTYFWYNWYDFVSPLEKSLGDIFAEFCEF
jgi:hypothetical protein